MFCQKSRKYLASLYGSFPSLGVFWWTQVLNFSVVKFILFFFKGQHFSVSCLKNLCLLQDHKDIFLFSLESFIVLYFTFKFSVRWNQDIIYFFTWTAKWHSTFNLKDHYFPPVHFIITCIRYVNIWTLVYIWGYFWALFCSTNLFVFMPITHSYFSTLKMSFYCLLDFIISVEKLLIYCSITFKSFLFILVFSILTVR